MSKIRIARRYADGLWDYALSVKEEEIIVEEMQSLINIINGSKDFQLFLKTPILETERKIQIAAQIFKSFSKTTQHFITLVIKQNRESDLIDIAEEVIHIYNEYKGILQVTITSAIPLEDKTISDILIKYGKLDDPKKVRVDNKIDESIIGGYILRLGDQQLDASVKTKLENIKKRFEQKVY
ncbi:ATP synthase F1 subunit delta [Apibacter adventoris]|uniref:ATP synthase F1 subunit delta n=1 Tax=Apibacter adventoris TaxID=1679466 RepID=UPI000CF5DF33|nr:ATP synthase F1 subunit delta [Apibacter adventoris]PQL95630.1 ATP synthase F1 subunit delta [Apibacter adventoris]